MRLLTLDYKPILSLLSFSFIIFAIAFHFPELEFFFAPINRIWEFCGLHQNWRLFSPDVPREASYVSGIITMQDGMKIMWEPPRPSRHSFMNKLPYARYVKWETDYLPWDIYKPYLPQLCEHVSGEFSFPGKTPNSCTLIYHGLPFADPAENFSKRGAIASGWYQTHMLEQVFSGQKK